MKKTSFLFKDILYNVFYIGRAYMSKLRDHYLFHAGISCFFYLGYGAFTVVLSMYCQDIGMSASQIAYIVSFAPLLSIATQPFFWILGR